jgi:NAD(P)-dependent dehydrogenase (short-subunit alcohol dehydrogenase family)
VLNILSVLSWISFPASGAYCAAKAAAWSMTNALRHELAAQGTQVSALHVGYIDIDIDLRRHRRQERARRHSPHLVGGHRARRERIIADDISAAVRARLADGVAGLTPPGPDETQRTIPKPR